MRIMVVEEKHSTYYLDCSTDELWAQASLWLLTKRFREGRWYLNPEVQYPDAGLSTPKAPELSPEQIAALPEGSEPRKLAERQMKQWEGWHAAKARYRAWFDMVKTLVEDQDDGFVTIGSGRYERQEPKAWRILDERSDAEYEHVTLDEADRPWETV